MLHRPASAISAALLLILWVVALSACAGGGSDGDPSGAAAPVVQDAWIRPPMAPDRPAAGYLVITGGPSDDKLVGASVDGIERIELHETTAGADGTMGMRPVSRIEVPAGQTVRLETGGFHLMLFGAGGLGVGDVVALTLDFEMAGPVVVEAEVRAG